MIYVLMLTLILKLPADAVKLPADAVKMPAVIAGCFI
jgi:hypothetical protein